jgi:plasmid maintenance system antidote protein VapI
MSVNAFARKLPVPSTRLHEVVEERCSITPYAAMRLARYFGGDAQS